MKREVKTEPHGKKHFCIWEAYVTHSGVQKTEITLNICDSKSNSNMKKEKYLGHK